MRPGVERHRPAQIVGRPDQVAIDVDFADPARLEVDQQRAGRRFDGGRRRLDDGARQRRAQRSRRGWLRILGPGIGRTQPRVGGDDVDHVGAAPALTARGPAFMRRAVRRPGHGRRARRRQTRAAAAASPISGSGSPIGGSTAAGGSARSTRRDWASATPGSRTTSAMTTKRIGHLSSLYRPAAAAAGELERAAARSRRRGVSRRREFPPTRRVRASGPGLGQHARGLVNCPTNRDERAPVEREAQRDAASTRALHRSPSLTHARRDGTNRPLFQKT